MKKHIALIGVKHCGKSTLGKKRAAEESNEFYDIDDVILEISGKTPRFLYDEGGSSLFQKWETAAIQKICSILVNGKKYIIATGGGFCDNEEAISLLKPYCSFVYIQVSEHTAWSRIVESAERDGRFPSYITRENPQTEADAAAVFHRFYVKRIEKYEKLADEIIKVL